MAVFLVTRTDADYEPIRIEAAGASEIHDYLKHQDHLVEMISVRTGPRMKRSYMAHADIQETPDSPQYKLVMEPYGRKLVEV